MGLRSYASIVSKKDIWRKTVLIRRLIGTMGSLEAIGDTTKVEMATRADITAVVSGVTKIGMLSLMTSQAFSQP